MPRPRPLPLFGALVLAGAGYLVLAWFQLVPGGWTLRGWIEPHAEREARFWREYRSERLAAFAAEPPAPAGSVVFLGSSTIERFPLETAFPAVPCLDRGIGNEDLDGLEARLETCLPAARPAGVVLYAGSVDFRFRGLAPAAHARRLGRLIERVRAVHPGVPIAVIGMLPELDFPAEMVAARAATDAALAAACEAAGAAFVSTDRPPITLPSGALAPDCAADRLHLDENGYRALTRWLVEDGGAVGEILAGE